MHTTSAKCNKKSINCANDFWAFYFENRSKIDTIIFAQTRRFERVLDLGDLKQNLLLLLVKNNVLEYYNPTKAGVFTYLTHKIRGYAWHLYTGGIPRKPEASRKVPAEQVYFYSINGFYPLQDHHDSSVENDIPSIDESLENQISYQEILGRIMKSLSPTNQRIMGMLLEGLTYRDISVALRVSHQAVLYRLRNIRRRFQSLVQRELIEG